MKDLKRQLQQMQKREEKLQEQLTALRGGTGTISSTLQPHPQAHPSFFFFFQGYTLKLGMGRETRLHYCTATAASIIEYHSLVPRPIPSLSLSGPFQCYLFYTGCWGYPAYIHVVLTSATGISAKFYFTTLKWSLVTS